MKGSATEIKQLAAALALLGISVGAVNTEPVQEFLYHITTIRVILQNGL